MNSPHSFSPYTITISIPFYIALTLVIMSNLLLVSLFIIIIVSIFTFFKYIVFIFICTNRIFMLFYTCSSTLLFLSPTFLVISNISNCILIIRIYCIYTIFRNQFRRFGNFRTDILIFNFTLRINNLLILIKFFTRNRWCWFSHF
jgi:hypothetical protein